MEQSSYVSLLQKQQAKLASSTEEVEAKRSLEVQHH